MVKVQNNVSAHLISVQIRCFALSRPIQYTGLDGIYDDCEQKLHTILLMRPFFPVCLTWAGGHFDAAIPEKLYFATKRHNFTINMFILRFVRSKKTKKTSLKPLEFFLSYRKLHYRKLTKHVFILRFSCHTYNM